MAFNFRPKGDETKKSGAVSPKTAQLGLTSELASLYSALEKAGAIKIPANKDTGTFALFEYYEKNANDLARQGKADESLAFHRAGKLIKYASSFYEKTPDSSNKALNLLVATSSNGLHNALFSVSNANEAAQLAVSNLQAMMLQAYLLGYSAHIAENSGLLEALDQAE